MFSSLVEVITIPLKGHPFNKQNYVSRSTNSYAKPSEQLPLLLLLLLQSIQYIKLSLRNRTFTLIKKHIMMVVKK